MKYKVKLLHRMAGPDGNFKAGTVVELPEHMARDLVKTKQATAVDRLPDDREKATDPAKSGK